jgi:DNA-binding HxlR family transcriptional regulator
MQVAGMQVAEASASKATRSAGRALELLVVPLNGLILKALDGGSIRLSDLRSRLGGPAQTTLRGHLSKLTELGVVEKRAPAMAPGPAEIGLTEMGRELLEVTGILESWLAAAPDGPIPLGSEAAKGTVKALAGGWESTMLRAFAARPLSLTQLDRLIGPLSYPALERRLSALRATGLVEAAEKDHGTPYTVTTWGRRGVGPISAAARFERRHLPRETPPLTPIDIEATFMLAVPKAPLPSNADGVCHLVAETPDRERRLASVEVAIDRGRVASCVSRTESSPRNWALGSSTGWLDALIERSVASLRIGGDRHLVCSLVFGLHELLLGSVGSPL